MNRPVAIIGYSGHSHMAIDLLRASGYLVTAYCDKEPKENNPYHLEYLGSEMEPSVLNRLKHYDYFIGIGSSNLLRRKIYEFLFPYLGEPVNAIHPSAVISPSAKLSYGNFISSNVCINAFTTIGKTVVCNTACVIEHGCIIGDFTFIAPGAVLNGCVTVDENSFVGANSVVKEGVKIGKNVIVGAGSVIISDVPDNVTIVGNPGKVIKAG